MTAQIGSSAARVYELPLSESFLVRVLGVAYVTREVAAMGQDDGISRVAHLLGVACGVGFGLRFAGTSSDTMEVHESVAATGHVQTQASPASYRGQAAAQAWIFDDGQGDGGAASGGVRDWGDYSGRQGAGTGSSMGGRGSSVGDTAG